MKITTVVLAIVSLALASPVAEPNAAEGDVAARGYASYGDYKGTGDKPKYATYGKYKGTGDKPKYASYGKYDGAGANLPSYGKYGNYGSYKREGEE